MNVKIIGAGSIGNHLANACVTQGLSVTIVDIDKEALDRTKNIIYPERYEHWDDKIKLTQPSKLGAKKFDIVIFAYGVGIYCDFTHSSFPFIFLPSISLK
mgnify:CR=1 FL=1